MKALLRPLVLAAGLALAPLAAPSILHAAPAAGLTQAEKEDIARIEQYLGGVRTLKSDFVQAGGDGSLVRGTLWLSRPNRMRLEYEPPIRDFIVADGWFVFYWDDELKQQSSAPIGSTMADIILRDKLRLSGDITVTDFVREANVIEVSVVQTSEPGAGTLTLVFEDAPLRLRKWRIVDPQGLTTEVALLNPQVGVQLDRDLFIFREPASARRRD
ncbi:outer membrane lipoprotein carrier protein LolA [Skermanella sp. TT6]|uniref:Outer membrane lipoprotein carrier protein LolA n=1 Tax=Skermanella cutis TaxID=2775420 RepID=A0ABX7B7S7_9PROT|nr:outer membrane lipoprotein carrier protein LolA [Skermanella sp. TT6]QQP89810.1 outer membrane lipoprotein carrier protein LolA [Skermanella sp. TT6]